MTSHDYRQLARTAFPSLRWSGDADGASAPLGSGLRLEVGYAWAAEGDTAEGDTAEVVLKSGSSEVSYERVPATPAAVRAAARRLLRAERRQAQAEAKRWERAEARHAKERP